ncbi:MAG: hypothetical protein D6748_02350 [Calditrichaeota bacterium]|nr:MAG: hypothetical protein D6748_02350 [Calditrichota bacterium]
MGYAGYDSDTRFEHSLRWIVGVGVDVAPNTGLVLEVDQGKTHLSYDGLLSIETIPVTHTIVSLSIQKRFLPFSNLDGIDLRLGTGMSRYSHPAILIQGGGLMDYQIPANSEWHPLFKGGVVIRKKIVKHLFIQLQPEIQMVMASPVHWHRAISGGLQIAIL